MAASLQLVRKAAVAAGENVVVFGVGIIGLGVIQALREAQTEAIRQQSVGFTQLWVLPAGQADRAAVQLGVMSQEAALTRYRLRLEVDGRLVREWQSIALRPSEQWQQTIALPAGYALAKLRFTGKKAAFGLVPACLLIPPPVTFLPVFPMLGEVGPPNTVPPWPSRGGFARPRCGEPGNRGLPPVNLARPGPTRRSTPNEPRYPFSRSHWPTEWVP